MSIATTAPTYVRRATASDVPTVADVLAQAFLDDPVFGWCLPEESRRAAVLPGFFELVASTLLGYDEVYQSGPRGAALWVPPGRPPVPEHAGERFEQGLVELFGVDAERTFAIVELLEAHHPAAPSRYLWFLGVRPDAQGAGIGSSLLSSMLGRCDRTGTPAYLEATSEANRRLYERHGFTVVEELTVDDSPTIWAMWRA